MVVSNEGKAINREKNLLFIVHTVFVSFNCVPHTCITYANIQ